VARKVYDEETRVGFNRAVQYRPCYTDFPGNHR
jgi:hypothetical protein